VGAILGLTVKIMMLQRNLSTSIIKQNEYFRRMRVNFLTRVNLLTR